SGTSLILLDEEDGRRRVVVLAASAQGLENSVNRLLNLILLNADYALSDCLVQDNLALCPSNVFDEAVEAELISNETPDTPIEEETPFPPEDEGDLGGGDGPNIDLEGVVLQGSISAGETVTGTLAEGETHSWMFVEGPATLDIYLFGEELDGVLEVYGPDLELLYTTDNSLIGEEEQLLSVEIPDDQAYAIAARDFFGRVADYVLSVYLSGEAE
ncbi:MAG: hypothetical protein GY803_00605, partial [Chloroflexi bacterium]|nr:hypothetical protein [Chloroflexota bacterium]